MPDTSGRLWHTSILHSESFTGHDHTILIVQCMFVAIDRKPTCRTLFDTSSYYRSPFPYATYTD